MELAAGAILTGKVTGITKFGAFVTLPDGKSGLVHISEVANCFVSDVHDFLTEGQEVQVKVLSMQPGGKINLSVKQALPAPPPRRTNNFRAAPRGVNRSAPRTAPAPAAPLTPEAMFEDKLKKFMTSSEGKMSELNRNRDSKRGHHKK
jgi:S1 RNA binding domain protein